MTTHRLSFREPSAPVSCLRYETNADARVREYLLKHDKDDDEIDNLLRAYHIIGRARATLGIQPGSPD